MAITVSQFKFNYRGQWQTSTLYQKNDIVQYNNAAYVCLQNISDEWKIAMEIGVNTNTYYTNHPEIYFADKRPDIETQYWRLIVRGNQFKRGWKPHTVYTYGDIVRYGGDLYMYTGTPGSGATATATINGAGNVVNVAVTNAGSGYAQPPLLTFGFDSLRGSFGATGYATISNTGLVTGVVMTNPGVNYQTAPTVTFNSIVLRNSNPEDPTVWVRVFQNPNRDSRRLYGVAFVNQQPLGWTRNNGDWPNPQTYCGNSVCWIGADGVPYSNGSPSNQNYNVSGRGIFDWVNSWQPSCFTFVDWLRSSDNATSLGLTGLTGSYLPTPDGLSPRCIQWVRTYWQSYFLFNNGEVYSAGFNDAYGSLGNSGTATVNYSTRVTNNGTTGWLGETLPRSFNQTKIIKVDTSNGGGNSNTSNNSTFALGSDGSIWAWGYNAYGQLGLGSPTSSAVNFTTSQILPIRIPAIYFDNKKIVEVMTFGAGYASTIAMDEDGDLWAWGTNYSGELGMGTGSQVTGSQYIAIPTRIPFDFKKFGGVKKMSYYHYNSADYRAVFILTNDGSLFACGGFRYGMDPNNQVYSPANAWYSAYRFTKYSTTNYNVKQVENFWIVGDSYAPNIFIREKDTGLTYGMGDNSRFTISTQMSQYNAQGTGITAGWHLIKGPRNVVAVTMHEAQSSGASTTVYLTVSMLDENGRVWGQGLNAKGSLSLTYAGQSNTTDVTSYLDNPEGGGWYNYWPIKTPSNTRIATIMGQGQANQDLGCYITDDGQVLYCGTDSANQTATSGMVQGQLELLWYYINITTATNNPVNRFSMHSLVSD